MTRSRRLFLPLKADLSPVPNSRNGGFRHVLACVLITAAPVHAGDILRGGLPANQKRAPGNSALTSAAAEKARTNAKDVLARTSMAIQSAQSLQNAARNAVR